MKLRIVPDDVAINRFMIEQCDDGLFGSRLWVPLNAVQYTSIEEAEKAIELYKNAKVYEI